MSREFLGWSRPLVGCAAEWIVERFGAATADLLVAVPGRRVARHFLESWAVQAPAMAVPPTVITVGALTDRLVRLDAPSADGLTRTFAWSRAIGDVGADELGQWVRRPPGPDDVAGRIALARLLRRLHGELAADGLTISEVLRSGHLPEEEVSRWEHLQRIHVGYGRILDELGLADPHEARLAAIRSGALRATGPVVLLGVVAPNGLQRLALDAVADRVHALVGAPAELADGFDELGALIAPYWTERDIPLPPSAVVVAREPADQAAACLRIMAGWDGRFAADQISVGVLDAEVVPFLRRQLAECGVGTRHGAGFPLPMTGVFRLLEAVGRFLNGRRYEDLMTCLRHPDLGVDETVVAAADRYRDDCLPDRVTRDWGTSRAQVIVANATAALKQQLGGLAGTDRIPLGRQAREVTTFLAAVYGGAALDLECESDSQRAVVLRAVSSAVCEFEAVAPELAPSVTGGEAIELLLEALRSTSVPPAPDPQAIELLGGLELWLDDAPALVITGVNEGRIPESVDSHLFLPNGLRRRLNMVDDRVRHARDAFALSAIAGSGRSLGLVTGRQNAAGDPLIPSRLLFQCGAEEAVARVASLFRTQPSTPAPPGEAAIEAHVLPSAPHDRDLTILSVSEFNAYLRSPYGFYLERVLRLKTVEEGVMELSPPRLGDVVHHALGLLGEDVALRAATDPDRIFAFLAEVLEERVRELVGAVPPPAVTLQVSNLMYRLRRFAIWQAAEVAAGWEITHAEWPADRDAVAVDLDGQTVGLKGRIDRIDRHQDTGQWRVLDYKTGDSGNTPAKAFGVRSGVWRDLQLPLYRRLVHARGLFADAPLLGYVNLARTDANSNLKLASWDKATLALADAQAGAVAAAIAAERFFELGVRPPEEGVLGAICGVGLLTPPRVGEAGE